MSEVEESKERNAAVRVRADCEVICHSWKRNAQRRQTRAIGILSFDRKCDLTGRILTFDDTFKPSLFRAEATTRGTGPREVALLSDIPFSSLADKCKSLTTLGS